MSMLRMSYDALKREHRISLVIDDDDLSKLRLDNFDQSVIDAPAMNAADHLQTAEIIVRRMIQQGIAFAPPLEPAQ